MSELVIGPVPVFDPHSESLIGERIIVVGGENIVSVVDDASLVPSDARRIEARGLTAIPGFIDSHTHLCYDGVPSRFSDPIERPGILAALAMRAMQQHLNAGVTTVRDCGAPDGMIIQLRDAIAQGVITGPRILAAGRMLTMTGGHGSQIGRLIDGPDSGTRGARAEIAEGADFVKLMSTGGVVTKGVQPEQVALQPEEIAAIVRATHEAGRRVTAHATGVEGAKNAIRAGVDSIEHGLNLDDEAVSLAGERNTMLVPTLIAVQRFAERNDELPSWMREKITTAVVLHEASFRRALAGGISIAAGTDSGTPFNPHGSLPQEIELLTHFGMSPGAALAAATLGSARNLGIEQLTGTIEQGKSADIVLVHGNPLEDLGVLQDPVMVLSRGREVARSGL